MTVTVSRAAVGVVFVIGVQPANAIAVPKNRIPRIMAEIVERLDATRGENRSKSDDAERPATALRRGPGKPANGTPPSTTYAGPTPLSGNSGTPLALALW